MNALKTFFVDWLNPKIDKSTNTEINVLNVTTTYYLCLCVVLVQTVGLVSFVLINIRTLSEAATQISAIGVLISIVLCLITLFAARSLKKKRELIAEHSFLVNTFMTVMASLIIFWGMLVSYNKYVNDEQMLTFYTVILVVVLFIKFKPAISIPLMTVSYWSYFLFLNIFVREGKLNAYNYAMLWLLSAVGAVVNYHVTVSNLQQRIRIQVLNDSLELIANHDSLTRLKNRYAFSQDVYGFLNKPMCIAIADVHRFKEINDTLGHSVGDDVLRRVGEVMREVFPNDDVYRYGGDEFVIIRSAEEDEEFESKLKQVNEILSDFKASGSDRCIGCSFGCVKAQANTTKEFLDYISQADKKLYEMKKTVHGSTRPLA